METGCYTGFFNSWALGNVIKHYKLRDGNILPWKVYTSKDFILHKSSKSGKTGTKQNILEPLNTVLTALMHSLQQITQNIYVMCNKNYRWHKAVCKESRQSKNQSHK